MCHFYTRDSKRSTWSNEFYSKMLNDSILYISLLRLMKLMIGQSRYSLSNSSLWTWI